MALLGIPSWTDQDLVIYHGTVDLHVPQLLDTIDVEVGEDFKDFGRGFYTTTHLDKAIRWARDRTRFADGEAAVIEFRVSRNDHASLDILWFVRSDPGALDFWSFVQYCRTIRSDHNRVNAAWYDIVVGPVTGSWKKQTVIADHDQLSFHTAQATAVLDRSSKGRIA